MYALEAHYHGRMLVVTALGDRNNLLTGAALLQVLRSECSVVPTQVNIEVTCPPHDFWLTFTYADVCTRVLHKLMQVWCAVSWIRFGRCHRAVRASSGAFEFKTMLSFKGLPDEAWEPEALNDILNKLGAELIDIIPPEDKREFVVTAWLCNPSAIPKVLTVEVLESKLALWNNNPLSNDDGESPPPPMSPRSRCTISHKVIVHVTSVVDRGHLLAEDLPDAYLQDEGVELRHEHVFICWTGRVDGTRSAYI
ncbi:unnamed protein product [Alopecurus aequalis]